MKMITFRGGELQQKGKGVGGFFRGILNFLKPLLKSTGTSAMRFVKSDTGKDIAGMLGKQALNSSVNMTKHLMEGNDLRTSLKKSARQFGSDVVDEIQKKRKKNVKKDVKKKKLTSLKSMDKYNHIKPF